MEQETITSADIGIIEASGAIVAALTKAPMRKMGEKEVFCAQCQVVSKMDLGLDKNNEVVCVCSCGRHLKFPLVSDPKEFEDILKAHHECNAGQVSVEMAAEAQQLHDDKFKKLLGIS